MTIERESDKPDKELKYFSSAQEAKLAYYSKALDLHQPIMVKLEGFGLLRTTVGRIIFNDILLPKLRFVNDVVGKGKLKQLVRESLLHYSQDEVVAFLDELKAKSFEFITKSGLSWGMDDLPSLPEKDKLIKEADEQVDRIQEQYEEGLLTESERYSKIIELWTNVKEQVT